METLKRIVSYIENLEYKDLPIEVQHGAKKYVLDTIGTTLAGSTAEGIQDLVKLMVEWGGKEESRIPVFGIRVPAPMAGLVNSSMARARDLDDVHERAGLHINAAIVPSAFIFSEYIKSSRGEVANGRKFLLASILGGDLLSRLRLAGGKKAQTGWSGDVFATIAIALMGGKLLEFNEERIFNAVGIAYAQAAGNMQAHVEGAMTVRLQQGMGAKAGILGVVLADKGFSGAKDALEGKFGLYPLYMRGDFFAEELTNELGKRFEGMNASIKQYPCCKMTHGAIDGAIKIGTGNRINPQDIDAIEISTNTTGFDLCGYGERKIWPQTIPDAQFSYYYTVAVALTKGRVFIDDFNEKAIRDAEVLESAKKVKVNIDPQKDQLKGMIPPIDIKVKMKNGIEYNEHVEYVKGHPNNPMTMDEVIQKFANCIRFSAKPMKSKKVDEICEMINNLDQIDDVEKILDMIQ